MVVRAQARRLARPRLRGRRWVTVRSRTGRDITDSVPELGAMAGVVDRAVVLDGELVPTRAGRRISIGWGHGCGREIRSRRRDGRRSRSWPSTCCSTRAW